MDLSCFLVLPISSQLKWKVKLNSPGPGTIVCTATAIPAFFRMKDNRWSAFLRMRDIYIDLTCFYTDVTPVTDFRIEYHRVIRCRNIGNRKHFFLRHVFLQKFIYKERKCNPSDPVISPYEHPCSLYCGLHTASACRPKIPGAFPRFLLCRFPA